jgi:hypothetical protein
MVPVFRIRIHLIRIWIQHFMLNTDPDPDPIRMQNFDDQKFKKLQLKQELDIFGSKTVIYGYLRIPRPP